MKTFIATLLAFLCAVPLVHAADSPYFRGPDRNGIFPETGLLETWPPEGPAEAWVTEGIGEGYASVSVVDGAIYVPGMPESEKGVMFKLDLEGNIVAQWPYGREVDSGQAPGPRSTPTIVGDRMYFMSSFAVVYCMELGTGKVLWEADTLARFGGEVPTWHFAESLVVEDGRVYCTPGGKDAGMAALDAETGETVWTTKGLSEAASYCSADIIEHNGRSILVNMLAKSVVGIVPETGEVLWTHVHETKYDVHAVTPVYANGILYYSGGYGSGGGALKLSDDGKSVAPLWSEGTLDCQHHGIVLLDGYLYGTGHQASNELICLELATGKVMWNTRDVRQGVVIAADGMLYVYGTRRGEVSLVKAQPDGFAQTGGFTMEHGTGKHWAHQVISGKRLYVRHGNALAAYDIAK